MELHFQMFYIEIVTENVLLPFNLDCKDFYFMFQDCCVF